MTAAKMKVGSELMSWKSGLCLLVVLNVYFPHAYAQEEEEKLAPPCNVSPKEKILFSSDNFPSNYNKDTDCSYYMKADQGNRVLLTFYRFQTETNSRCSYDRVEVYDSDKTMIHKFCGRNSNNVQVISSKDSMELKFITDRVSEYSGFLASWRQVKKDFVLDQSEDQDGKYYLTFPTTFIQDSEEKICVELFDQAEPTSVNATIYVFDKIEAGGEIEHRERRMFDEGSATFSQTKSVRIEAQKPVHCFTMTIPEGELSPASDSKGLINFKIEGPGINVNTFKSINIGKKENHPLIQTDKGQYKAGDSVKFRILIIDDDIKPSQEITTVEQMWIEDPKSRRMQQWDKIDLNKGLLQEEFTLSEEPELGDWTIHFEAGRVSGKTTFKVAEYVLPKFEVKIIPPAAVLKDATEVEFKVCAEYTHGGSVKGDIEATFTSTRVIRTWPQRREDKRTVSVIARVGDEDECGIVKLNKQELHRLTEKVNNFQLSVVFREKGTSTTASAETSASLQDKPFKIDVKEGSRQFIVGGFPYTGELSVTNHDGSPRNEENLELCVAFYRDVQKIRDIFNKRGIWSMDEEEITETGKKMAKLQHSRVCQNLTSTDGQIKFYVPMNNIPDDVVKMIAKVSAVDFPDNEETGMKQPNTKLSVSLTHSQAGIALSLNDKRKSKVACDAEFKPKVYFAAKLGDHFNLHYLALSKGTIFKSDSLKVEVKEMGDAVSSLLGESSQEHHRISPLKDADENSNGKVVSYQSLAVPIDYTVSPSLKLIVFVNYENVTLGDSYTYQIDDCQRHKVSVKFSEDKVYPGSPVSLAVSSEPGSLCGISAVDKSVELLGNNNKITRDTVSKLRAQVGDRKTSRWESYWEYQRKCPDSYDIVKVFENTGIQIDTDLPVMAKCELLTDAVNVEEQDYDDYEVAHSLGGAPGPVANRVAVFSAAPQSAAFAADIMDAPPPPPLQEVIEPKLEIRTDFPDTWLFDLEEVEPQGSRLTREMMSPHTITTWIAEAVCLHEEAGLGVAEPDQLLVSQDFFAEINLPYSVKRGEGFPLNISIFNYLDQQLPIRAELMVDDKEIRAEKTQVDVCVKAKNNEVISLKVAALELGEVNITVKATIKNDINVGCGEVSQGEGFSDALVKPLRVKAEGVPVEIVQSEFKCVENEGVEEWKFDALTLPDDVVEGSERGWVHLTGDVMAPALDNVGNLVRLPTGCGEQNMVGLVPNIYLLNYLNGVGKKVPEVERKAIDYMNIGYKRQQNYRHRDGSYSIWGDNGMFERKDGSTWLTAFVVKAFSEASQYISVDAKMVQQSIDWLFKNQMENGCFMKRGYVHSSYLKGGLSDDSLTAFVVTALQTASTKFKDVEVDLIKLDNAYSCMVENVNENDLYTSIVVANAAARFREEKALEMLSKIEERANTSTGLTFWELKKKKVTCRYCWWSYRPSSEAVEMTAYNILTYVMLNKLPEALPSVKWLAKQRNSQGGFVSTQDTVVALEALSEYMRSVTRTELDMNIDMATDSDKLESASLNDDNALLLQTQRLQQLPTSLAISSSGSGCAMVQTVLRYNTQEVKENNAAFSLKVTPMNVNSVDQAPSLQICTTYTGNEEKTGMVLVEVEMVTGWEAVTPERLINEVDSGVQRVETDKEENKVVLYFDEMTNEGRCVSLEMKDVMVIDEAKDALVTVYDYYNREETASVLYNMDLQ